MNGLRQGGPAETPVSLSQLFITPSKGNRTLINSRMTQRKHLESLSETYNTYIVVEKASMTWPKLSAITSCITQSTQITCKVELKIHGLSHPSAALSIGRERGATVTRGIVHLNQFSRHSISFKRHVFPAHLTSLKLGCVLKMMVSQFNCFFSPLDCTSNNSVSYNQSSTGLVTHGTRLSTHSELSDQDWL